MNIEKLRTEVKKGYPIFVVYTSDTKELVDWYPFGEKMAKTAAESRNNKVGPNTHTYGSWQNYTVAYNNHQRHLADLAEPWRHR
ncbi:hypothetical protein N9E09_00065 [bacterium]|jgi:hypothetical protein|nr:hypothetical protein [bacterium]